MIAFFIYVIQKKFATKQRYIIADYEMHRRLCADISGQRLFPSREVRQNLLISIGVCVRTFRARWKTSTEDRKNSFVTKVGEKTWHDSTKAAGLFSGKADNHPRRTFRSRKTRLVTHNGRIVDRINNPRDADILSLMFEQAGSRLYIHNP